MLSARVIALDGLSLARPLKDNRTDIAAANRPSASKSILAAFGRRVSVVGDGEFFPAMNLLPVNLDWCEAWGRSGHGKGYRGE
jgi:hypothetical protein